MRGSLADAGLASNNARKRNRGNKMLYSKAHFAVRHAASTDETRYNLNGLHFRGDGTTEATDGHMLIRIKAATPAYDEHPNGTEGVPEPFILPLEAAHRVAKAIPKRSPSPVLTHAALDVPSTNGNGSARFVVTDGYNGTGNEQAIEAKKIEGEYPNTDQVIPKDAPFSFCINLTLLERVIKASKEFGGSGKGKDSKGKDSKGNQAHFAKFHVTDNSSPVRITISNPDVGELEAVIMPVRV